LTSPSLPFPIADSVDITHYLAALYPSLIPPTHAYLITQLLQELHNLNFFSLSFANKPPLAQGYNAGVLRRLKGEAGELSERYRKALEYKLVV
jgi:glutathione S-transferase